MIGSSIKSREAETNYEGDYISLPKDLGYTSLPFDVKTFRR